MFVRRYVPTAGVWAIYHPSSGAVIGQQALEGLAAERSAPFGVRSLPYAVLVTQRGEFDGEVAIASDIAMLPEFEWRAADGRWTPRGGRQMLAQYGSTSLVSPAALTDFWRFTIPAGMLFGGQSLQIDYAWSYPSNTNTKTLQLQLGSTAMGSISRNTAGPILDVNTATIFCTSDTAQTSVLAPGASLTAVGGTGTVATTAGTTVALRGLAASDTITLAQSRLWLVG